MKISLLRLIHFRNQRDSEYEPGEELTVFTGR